MYMEYGSNSAWKFLSFSIIALMSIIALQLKLGHESLQMVHCI